MGHWYSKDGKPQHFTKDAKGNSRDSTLRDARKHGWYPSVTEIINTLDKPALVNWKVKQVLTAALTLPYLPDEGVDDYYTRVMKDAFVESTEARNRGSLIHEAIEAWFNGKLIGYDDDITDIALAASSAIYDYTQTFASGFTPEYTVVGDGYGGMIDLHNDGFLIDYKTKEISSKDWDKYCVYMADQQTDSPKGAKPPKLAYPEMCMQLAAYQEAIDFDSLQNLNRRLINVFIDRKIPGRVIIHEWTPEEAETAYDKFYFLVKYWQLAKNYNPNEL